MMTIIVLVLCLITSSTYIIEGRNNKEKVGLANVAPLPIGGVYDVTKYHAVGDGFDDTEEGESANAMVQFLHIFFPVNLSWVELDSF